MTRISQRAQNALLVIATAATFASRADAQACLGLGSLASQPANATFTALFTDGAKALDARVGFGSSIAFGGVALQLQDYDNIEGTGKSFTLDGGLSFLTGAKRNVAVCPVASLGYTMLPDGGLDSYDASTTDGTAGLAIGARLGTQSSVALIPFASIQAVYSRLSIDGPGADGSDTDSYGLLAGGMSFVLSPSFLIRPIVQIPLGLRGSDPSYGIGISLGFGGR